MQRQYANSLNVDLITVILQSLGEHTNSQNQERWFQEHNNRNSHSVKNNFQMLSNLVVHIIRVLSRGTKCQWRAEGTEKKKEEI